MTTALLVIATLVFLIVTHELGHFIAAKILGVRVDEFGVGYPPRALLFGTWGGTEYTLNWLPFGGFVRLYGEEQEHPRHGSGSFVDAPRWRQAAILVAGVSVNALVAWFLFAGALTMGIPRTVDAPEPGMTTQLIVSHVVPGSPADVAGLAVGDQILGIVDEAGAQLSTLTPNASIEYVREHGGDRLTITYLHGEATSTAYAIPANAILPEAAGRPALGVGLALVTADRAGFAQALADSIPLTIQQFKDVGRGLWQIISDAIGGSPDISQVVGPVGIVSYVHEAEKNGLGYVLMLAGFISVNLAIVNLIPIPALDGGRLFILALESLMRRPAPKLAVQIINTTGIALVMLLMLAVTYNDIARLFAW